MSYPGERQIQCSQPQNLDFNDRVNHDACALTTTTVSTDVQSTDQKDFGFLPIPKSLNYDCGKLFVFTTTLNVCFGLGSTFSELQRSVNKNERFIML